MTSKDLNIIKQYESGDKEDFIRPDHSDFLSSLELKQKEFSGVRHNRISSCREVWIRGEVKLEMNERLIAANPHNWDQKYAELFGLHNVETLKGI